MVKIFELAEKPGIGKIAVGYYRYPYRIFNRTEFLYFSPALPGAGWYKLEPEMLLSLDTEFFAKDDVLSAMAYLRVKYPDLQDRMVNL